VRGGRHHRYKLGIESPIVRCTTCGLIFPDPFPYPVEPQKLYGDPDKYFVHHNEAQKIEQRRLLARELADAAGGTRLLDVGSGRGEMLAAAKAEGLTPVGLEFAQAMIDYVRTEHGITVLDQSIEDHAETGAEYDIVALIAVLEHVYEPAKMIAAAAQVCRPGGVLYIDIPNEPNLFSRVGNAAARLRGRRVSYNIAPTFPPYHVYGFNSRALSILLRQHGFQITSSRVCATAQVSSDGTWPDRAAAIAGTAVNHVANWTRTASNLYVHAVRLRA
jgi:SAM-dependent methyltransferase